MRTLSQKELLAAWEAGLGLTPPMRAVELLRADGTEADPFRLTPGQRDAALLGMRERLFGSDISATAACPKCGEEQEFEMRVEDIRTTPALLPADAEARIDVDGYSVVFRMPVAADLIGLDGDTDAIRTALLERCILRAEASGAGVSAAELPEAVIAAVSQRMAEADPQSDVELSIECASCKHSWLELFDIVSFFCSEVQSWALRTLNEVHQLAAAYGWSESEVLSVSPRRRAYYLDLIAG